MKVRKVKEIKRALSQKGFVLDPSINHHNYYYLVINGKKHPIYTYLSHGKNEYDTHLMAQIKKQLKFPSGKDADDYFDCTLTGAQYVKLLKDNGHIKE